MVYTGYGNREEQSVSDLLSPASAVDNNVEQNAQEVRIPKIKIKRKEKRILGGREEMRKSKLFDPLKYSLFFMIPL